MFLIEIHGEDSRDIGDIDESVSDFDKAHEFSSPISLPLRRAAFSSFQRTWIYAYLFELGSRDFVKVAVTDRFPQTSIV